MEPLEPQLQDCQEIAVLTGAGNLRFPCVGLAKVIWQAIRE
jgi:hypothetical protein